MTTLTLAEHVQVGDRIRILTDKWLTVESVIRFTPPLKDEHMRFTGHVDGDTRRYTSFRQVGEQVETEQRP